MSTIFEPADLIINLLFVPRLFYFCAFFAYDGLRNGVTLTHAGIRKGSIARLYGFLYLLVCIFQLMILPSLLRELLAVDPKDLKQALTLSLSSPEIGLIFLGLAVFLYFMRERLSSLRSKKPKHTRSKPQRIAAGRKFTNWMIAMIFAIGIPPLLGLPHFFTVGVYAFFTYFSPFTSPMTVKELMSTFINENEQPEKSTSPV